MKANLLIALVAAMLFPLPAFAQECSGGAAGGMDATGNECNASAVATTVSSYGAASSSTPLSKVAANRAIPCSKCAFKRTATEQHTAGRHRTKHS
jgi:hypothetical protein